MLAAKYVSSLADASRRNQSSVAAALDRQLHLKLTFLCCLHLVLQLFKSTVKIWTRDRFSILAQLCTTTPKLPKLCPEEDAFFFDRDFWIFRFIYSFLRDNTLPDSIDVLRELYCEASFYRIGLLRHAIESKMIGDDAIAASVLSSPASRVAPPPSSSSLPSTRPLPSSGAALKKESSSKSIVREKLGATPSKATPTAPSSAHHKYSELPDPFGFTSKKER